jgi:hypothetical protein
MQMPRFALSDLMAIFDVILYRTRCYVENGLAVWDYGFRMGMDQ